jgi:hypothetical protein
MLKHIQAVISAEGKGNWLGTADAEVHRDDRVTGFREKPADPQPLPGDTQRCLASMGIYVVTVRFLFGIAGRVSVCPRANVSIPSPSSKE